jgi:TRAP transporter TAXI family solute receptor
MRIGTAEHNSTFTQQALTLKNVISEAGYAGLIEIIETTFSSTENVQKLSAHDIDFGYIAANWLGRAKAGQPPFTTPHNISIVAPMNIGPMYFISRPDLPLTSARHIKGKIVSVGPPTSGTCQHAQSLLTALGIGFSDITPVFHDFKTGAHELRAGRIDVQLQCPYPNAVIAALDQTIDFHIVDLSEDELNMIIQTHPIYHKTLMPKGSLRALKHDSWQAGVLNVMITHDDTPADLVSFMAQTIVTHAARLETQNPLYNGLRRALADLSCLKIPDHEGVKLHPASRAILFGHC